jgi:hypothetical protein
MSSGTKSTTVSKHKELLQWVVVKRLYQSSEDIHHCLTYVTVVLLGIMLCSNQDLVTTKDNDYLSPERRPRSIWNCHQIQDEFYLSHPVVHHDLPGLWRHGISLEY